jgi:4-hydroxybenzoate polyprenyltransferase
MRFLELIRPPNVATALADVLAGFAVAGLAAPRALPWLLLSTACLYAGGIVFNDVFDRKLDAVERPERPIPSGRVPVGHAAVLGAGLLGTGVLAAALAGGDAPLVAVAIVALVLLYDAWGKRVPLVGPINMGLCRGFNLLLGMAAVGGTVAANWPLALIAVTYIAAVTMVSRGEVSGGQRGVAVAAFVLILAALAALSGAAALARGSILAAFGFTLLLAWRVVPPFWRAARHLAPETARQAVRTGVLSLVLLDAVIAAAYAGIIYSLAVLATAVLAGRLARLFAVT